MPLVAIAAAVSIGATAYQIVQGQKANRERREGRRISNANETLRNRSERRRKIKELRIRRSQINQASENTGVAGSSGQLGGVAAMQSSFGSAVANQSQNSLAVQGINTRNQNAANAVSNAKTAAAFDKLIQSSVELFE